MFRPFYECVCVIISTAQCAKRSRPFLYISFTVDDNGQRRSIIVWLVSKRKWDGDGSPTSFILRDFIGDFL